MGHHGWRVCTLCVCIHICVSATGLIEDWWENASQLLFTLMLTAPQRLVTQPKTTNDPCPCNCTCTFTGSNVCVCFNAQGMIVTWNNKLLRVAFPELCPKVDIPKMLMSSHRMPGQFGHMLTKFVGLLVRTCSLMHSQYIKHNLIVPGLA